MNPAITSIRRVLGIALAAGLCAAVPCRSAVAEPKPPHHMNLPKPTPPSGDTRPWVVAGSPLTATAPTVAVIGDSVARDYAYYLSGRLGPKGVRVIDGAVSGCPVGTLRLVAAHPDGDTPLRGGKCPQLVPAKQLEMLASYVPKIIVWSSITEIWGMRDGERNVASGSDEWRERVQAEWDDTLRRVTAGGAHVLVILPLWYERSALKPSTASGPSVNKLRDLYKEWAARHKDKVSVVDVAPLVCPAGPPCAPVNGIDFRPDTTHYDDPGGILVGAYLEARVPELAELTAGH